MCSLYSLQQILHTHLFENTKGQDLVDKFYVHNYMHTYDDEHILINDNVILEELMLEACMPLQSRISNNQQLKGTYEIESNLTQNVLRLAWHPHAHTLKVA